MKNVIFDFGNVLVDWDPYLALREYYPTKADMLSHFETIQFFAWNTEQDRGRSWEDGFAWVDEHHPENAHIFRTYLDRIQDAHRDAIPGMPELLRELFETGVAVFGLTNAAEESFQAVRKTVPEVDQMADILVSAKEGLIKPSREIYELCLSRNGLIASDTIMIDDRADNCAGAEAVGMHSHQFVDALALRRALSEHSLLAHA